MIIDQCQCYLQRDQAQCVIQEDIIIFNNEFYSIEGEKYQSNT